MDEKYVNLLMVYEVSVVGCQMVGGGLLVVGGGLMGAYVLGGEVTYHPGIIAS